MHDSRFRKDFFQLIRNFENFYLQIFFKLDNLGDNRPNDHYYQSLALEQEELNNWNVQFYINR